MMYRIIKNHSEVDTVIRVTMYLQPIIYENSEIFSSVQKDAKNHKYHTDVNPSRIINGPLSEKGEMLEPPISEEYDKFIEDCKYLVEEVGFEIIQSTRSEESHKSEYIIVFGLKGNQCGTLVYDLRISDHPYDAIFPEEIKDDVVAYLQINKVLDGSATKAGIDFKVEKVIVGSVKNDTWDRAFNRLYDRLKRMKSAVQIRLRSRE